MLPRSTIFKYIIFLSETEKFEEVESVQSSCRNSIFYREIERKAKMVFARIVRFEIDVSQKRTSRRDFPFFREANAWRLANRNVAAGGGRLKLTFPATTLARKRTEYRPC